MDDDALIREFIDAAVAIFKWYDGDRKIIVDKGYVYPAPIGAHAITQLRTAMQNAGKAGHVLPEINAPKTFHQLTFLEDPQ